MDEENPIGKNRKQKQFLVKQIMLSFQAVEVSRRGNSLTYFLIDLKHLIVFSPENRASVDGAVVHCPQVGAGCVGPRVVSTVTSLGGARESRSRGWGGRRGNRLGLGGQLLGDPDAESSERGGEDERLPIEHGASNQRREEAGAVLARGDQREDGDSNCLSGGGHSDGQTDRRAVAGERETDR